MAQPTIGFIGMGLMGVPMTLRLLGAGYEVRVWNRSIDKCAGVVSAGAILTDKLDDLVRHSDIVMLCVTDTTAVSDIVFGEAGVANSARAGQVLVDFSSIEPQATRMMAERLYTTSGCIWIDAPVSGGVAGAEQGTLAIMAGGPEDVLATIRPVLAPLSQRVTRVGDVGSGQVTKICNQMLVSCNVLVMAEVMALAEKAGVDAEQIPVALKGGFADSIPLQLTGPRMAKRDFDEVKWHVKTLLKDLDMANNLAKIMNSSAPMVGLGVELMRLHASQGNAERDPCTLVSMYVEKPE
ncbi:MAG: 2-hydroxy-3-oxopropionate reductase [Thalassobium sp.]|nr:MAG: 2-hydroxy-3-oxopropionate reductase [Oceanospirillales bacterium]PHQ87453.1 MAG: 2-hydroxy-3-oxopropionate reductase [Thalassobium sp.]